MHNALGEPSLLLHIAILGAFFTSVVWTGGLDAQRTDFSEQSAGIDAELLGSRCTITTVAAKCVGYVQSFEGLEC